MITSLTKTEATILKAAAEHPDGLIVLPDSMKPTGRQRLLGRLVRDRLAYLVKDAHHVTPTGFKAIGLKPPRRSKPVGPEVPPGRTDTKKALVAEMLGRAEGATLAELIAATGWLPHTTRAALSRIRKTGQALDKRPRPDGASSYRVAAATLASSPARESRQG